MKISKIIYGILSITLIIFYVVVAIAMQDCSTKIFNIISIIAGAVLCMILIFHAISYFFLKIKDKERLKKINYSIMSFCLAVTATTINLYSIVLNIIILCVALIFFWLSFCDNQ